MGVNAAGRSGYRRWLWFALKLAVVIGIFTYLALRLTAQWGKVRSHFVEMDITFVAWAVILQAFSMVLLALLWRELMGDLGAKMTVIAALRMQWLSTLGKYIPGKVSTTFGKIYLARVEGIDPKLVGVGCIYEICFCTAGASLTALLSVMLGSLGSARFVAVPAATLLVLLLACVHPRLLVPAVNWVLRRFRLAPIEHSVPFFHAILFSLGYSLPYILSGVSEFALLKAYFGEVPTRYMIDLVGLSTVATVFGFLALFAPGGLGVRDLLMSSGVGQAFFGGQAGPGELFALSTRLFGLVMDFASGIISLALYGRVLWRTRTPPSA